MTAPACGGAGSELSWEHSGTGVAMDANSTEVLRVGTKEIMPEGGGEGAEADLRGGSVWRIRVYGDGTDLGADPA